MQFNLSLNKQEYISNETSNKRTLGARALVVRDSNVSKWCLRARRGIESTRKKYFCRELNLLKFRIGSFLESYLESSHTTIQVQVNLIHSFSIYRTLR